MKSLFSRNIEVTAKVMDLQLQRQNVDMGNLANIRTPGYKERKFLFEDQLQAALGLDAKGRMTQTEKGHMPAEFDPDTFGPEWSKVFKPRVVHGEDQVDLDKTMAQMAKTAMNYSTLTTVIKKNFDGLRTIIQEGQK